VALAELTAVRAASMKSAHRRRMQNETISVSHDGKFPGKDQQSFGEGWGGKIGVNFLTQIKSKIYGIRRSFSSRVSNLLKGVHQGL
jgi:hypothetical protein